jgi:pre-rRNA-processing protein TSR3
VSRRGPGPIVLDPYARTPLLRSDHRLAEAGGLLAVDCSWNRLGERGRFPDGTAAPARWARRLPILVATNPQHYGRVAQLNTVEALAAALHLVGRPEEAERILEGFRGADQFLEVNRERLDAYAAAVDAAGLEAAESRLFGGPERPASRAVESSALRSRDARPAHPRPK